MDIRDFTSTRKSKIELVFTDDLRREPNRTVPLGSVYSYLGNMGTQHLLNIAFSKANEVLSKTEYDKVGWRAIPDIREGTREREYQFVKREPNGELAVLCVVKRY